MTRFDIFEMVRCSYFSRFRVVNMGDNENKLVGDEKCFQNNEPILTRKTSAIALTSPESPSAETSVLANCPFRLQAFRSRYYAVVSAQRSSITY